MPTPDTDVTECDNRIGRMHGLRCMIRSQGANGPPLGSPKAALNMEALLNELVELNDQADALMEPEHDGPSENKNR